MRHYVNKVKQAKKKLTKEELARKEDAQKLAELIYDIYQEKKKSTTEI